MKTKHTLWSRALFLLPAVVAAVPFMLIVLWVYGSTEPLTLFAILVVSGIVAFLICLVPPIQRFDRFLAANLLGTELNDGQSTKAYRNSAIFVALHLLIGFAVLVCILSVPLVISELLWRTERVVEWSLSFSQAYQVYLEAVLWSELRIALASTVLLSGIAVVAYVLCAPLLARQLLGTSLEQKLADSEAERERLEVQNDLARDIHDSIGHTLTIASLQAEKGRALLESDPPAADDALDTILLVCRRAQSDLDDVLRVLRTGQPRGGAHARDMRSLGDLIDNARHAGLTVDVDIPLNLVVPPDRSQALYRIVQEALTNALRYANPREFSIAVANDEADGLRILAHNPLLPTAQCDPGRGLHGIDARARLLDGSSTAEIIDGRFILDVRIPPRPVGAAL